ncbi:hypothetical protein Tco_0882870 [Tanacetum coccineum]
MGVYGTYCDWPYRKEKKRDQSVKIRTMKEFQLLQLQELKARKDKLKAKTEKIDSLSESYKKRIEFVRKLEVITDIKIITNTKPLKVIVIKDNDDSNFKVISEFKWRLFGYKEWEITLVVLNKKKGDDVVELVKTLGK